MTGNKYRKIGLIHGYFLINHYCLFLLHIAEFQAIIRTSEKFYRFSLIFAVLPGQGSLTFTTFC